MLPWNVLRLIVCHSLGGLGSRALEGLRTEGSYFQLSLSCGTKLRADAWLRWGRGPACGTRLRTASKQLQSKRLQSTSRSQGLGALCCALGARRGSHEGSHDKPSWLHDGTGFYARTALGVLSQVWAPVLLSAPRAAGGHVTSRTPHRGPPGGVSLRRGGRGYPQPFATPRDPRRGTMQVRIREHTALLPVRVGGSLD